MTQSHLRRVVVAFSLVTLVSLTPASAATRAGKQPRARVQSTKTQTSWIVQIVTNVLTDAGILIDPNGAQ
jgi:hypothetical protein